MHELTQRESPPHEHAGFAILSEDEIVISQGRGRSDMIALNHSAMSIHHRSQSKQANECDCTSSPKFVM
jgi:hypothetical protein